MPTSDPPGRVGGEDVPVVLLLQVTEVARVDQPRQLGVLYVPEVCDVREGGSTTVGVPPQTQFHPQSSTHLLEALLEVAVKRPQDPALGVRHPVGHVEGDGCLLPPRRVRLLHQRLSIRWVGYVRCV